MSSSLLARKIRTASTASARLLSGSRRCGRNKGPGLNFGLVRSTEPSRYAREFKLRLSPVPRGCASPLGAELNPALNDREEGTWEPRIQFSDDSSRPSLMYCGNADSHAGHITRRPPVPAKTKMLPCRKGLSWALRETNGSLQTVEYEVRIGKPWFNKIGCRVHAARLRSA